MGLTATFVATGREQTVLERVKAHQRIVVATIAALL